jgi:hypothetical protein
MLLSDKLSKIQALIERASSEGERQAALLAKERILSRQTQLPMEYRVTLKSIWQKTLFVALCKKYGFRTYRYHRQKFTTTMVHISPAVMDELLWPEYLKHSEMLQELIQDILDSMLAKIEKGEDEVVLPGELGVAHEFAGTQQYAPFCSC